MNTRDARKLAKAMFGSFGRAYRSKRDRPLVGQVFICTVGRATPTSGTDEALTSWTIYGQGATWALAFQNLAWKATVTARNSANAAEDLYAQITRNMVVSKATRQRAEKAQQMLQSLPRITYADITRHD